MWPHRPARRCCPQFVVVQFETRRRRPAGSRPRTGCRDDRAQPRPGRTSMRRSPVTAWWPNEHEFEWSPYPSDPRPPSRRQPRAARRPPRFSPLRDAWRGRHRMPRAIGGVGRARAYKRSTRRADDASWRLRGRWGGRPVAAAVRLCWPRPPTAGRPVAAGVNPDRDRREISWNVRC